MNDEQLKEVVKNYWEQEPCGSWAGTSTRYSKEYFDEIEEYRYRVEPFIPAFARFPRFKGKKVLEIGVGAGTDHLQFARAGALLSGIDLTREGIMMVKKRLDLETLSSDLRCGDAEHLPFPDNEFDLVYSWGVLHHTPDTQRALDEAYRVCRPGGEICIMLYHLHSVVAVKLWIARGLLRMRPFRSLRDVIYHHMESKGTKAYTRREIFAMFSKYRELSITPVVTCYDIPPVLSALVPSSWGWFLVIQGIK